MGVLQSPMISALPGSPAAALLAREDQSRREGSGIQIEQLPGCWMLQQTWTRSGDPPAPGTATLLRWLQASLTLSRGDQGLSIVNQVCLAGFRLRLALRPPVLQQPLCGLRAGGHRHPISLGNLASHRGDLGAVPGGRGRETDRRQSQPPY